VARLPREIDVMREVSWCPVELGSDVVQKYQNGGIGVGARPLGVGPSFTHPRADPLDTGAGARKVRRFQR